MQKAHRYTLPDRLFAVSVNCGSVQPGNSTLDPLPPMPWAGVWPRWTGKAWELVPDHRERKAPYFAPEHDQDATEYWLPAPFGDDAHDSPARIMRDPGPLPAGHRLTRPVKPLATAKADKLRGINAGYEAALVAALTMPSAAPTPMTVAMETSALLAVDPDGVDSIRAVLDARRSELRAQVEAVRPAAADTTDAEAHDAAVLAAVVAVESISVRYPV